MQIFYIAGYPINWDYDFSMRTILKYWFPRLIIIGFALSMPFSTPEFIAGMDEGSFLVWRLRLIWVLVFPLVFCLLLILTLVMKRLKQGKKK